MIKANDAKSVVEQLAPEEKSEFFRWLGEREDFQRQQWEDLRSEIAVGLDQAERGDLAPLDIEAIKKEACRRKTTSSA